jgi:hypothetical protein
MKWFKHDSDANMDAKLKRLRIKYGMAGYGLYWYCLELIAQGIDQNNLTFELEHDAEILAHDTGINYQLVSEMMVFMVDLGLFENNDGVITCIKMAMRLDDHTSRNPQIKQIQAKLFKQRSDSEVTPKPLNSRIDNNTLDNNTKDKKTKPKAKRFVPPTLDDVRLYFYEKGERQATEPAKFHAYYESNGWMVGKNKMKSWQAAANGWISRNADKPVNKADNRAALTDAVMDVHNTNW